MNCVDERETKSIHGLRPANILCRVAALAFEAAESDE